MKLSTAGFAAVLLAPAALRHSRRRSLRGRKVLITSGSRGLGFAAAPRFVKQGADVAICARDQAELDRASAALRAIADSSARKLRSLHRVVAVRADVTDQHAALELVNRWAARRVQLVHYPGGTNMQVLAYSFDRAREFIEVTRGKLDESDWSELTLIMSDRTAPKAHDARQSP